jgi:hypothetical protein
VGVRDYSDGKKRGNIRETGFVSVNEGELSEEVKT